MFIYFPEFIYRHTKQFITNTFRSEINELQIKEVLKNTINSENNYIADFKNKKISLPTLKFEHCNNIFNSTNKINPKIISYYNLIDNEIIICKNMIEGKEHFSQILSKELSYAYNYNSNNNKSLSLNDYAKMSILACKNYYSQTDVNIYNKLLTNEKIKRCANLELKYKFEKELLKSYYGDNPTNSYEDINLNNFVKKLIDQNY
jgi:hypothetical protein